MNAVALALLNMTPFSVVLNKMKLDLAKIIEQRKRSRIERARQLSSNIDTQAHILRQTELFNLAAEYQRLASFLKPFGQNVPVVEKACFDAMKDRIEKIEEKNIPSFGKNTAIYVSRQRTLSGNPIATSVVHRSPWKLKEPSTGPGLGPFANSLRTLRTTGHS